MDVQTGGGANGGGCGTDEVCPHATLSTSGGTYDDGSSNSSSNSDTQLSVTVILEIICLNGSASAPFKQGKCCAWPDERHWQAMQVPVKCNTGMGHTH
jgi:nitrite reductase/ring-hydroxylating ferredoxin subunit